MQMIWRGVTAEVNVILCYVLWLKKVFMISKFTIIIETNSVILVTPRNSSSTRRIKFETTRSEMIFFKTRTCFSEISWVHSNIILSNSRSETDRDRSCVTKTSIS